MRIAAADRNLITLVAGRHEITVIIAAARMALELIDADPDAPTEAKIHLARALHSYDAAIAAQQPPRTDRHPSVPNKEPSMHVKIINFNLVDMTEEGYREACDQLAPAFAALPGLLTKIWLCDSLTNTYGGVYLFADSDASDAYAASELFQTVGAFPNFTNITVRDFSVDEDNTRRTQPGIEVIGSVGASV